MLSDLGTEKIQASLTGTKGSLELILHPSADGRSALDEPLAELAARIETASAGALHVERGDGAGLAALPCLTIAHHGLGKIHYQSAPQGPEAAPFLEALLGPAGDQAGAAGSWAERLSLLARPAELLVFVGASCPHCPGAVRSANRIALATPLVSVSIVDVQVHAELAARFNVRAVPLTLLDGEMALTGVIRSAELVDAILSREDAGHAEGTLQSLVEQGRFGEISGQLRTGPGAAHFVAIWKRSNTSLRMGLMMAAEEALESDRGALDGLVADLLPALRAEDAALRGDTATLLGTIGLRSATAALKALLEDPNPDVAEIASEALEEIEERWLSSS
jgi:alkyl hydroperoxide reductase subunit AhpF